MSTANAWSKLERLLLLAKPRWDLQLAVLSIDAIGGQLHQLYNLSTKEVKKVGLGINLPLVERLRLIDKPSHAKSRGIKVSPVLHPDFYNDYIHTWKLSISSAASIQHEHLHYSD